MNWEKWDDFSVTLLFCPYQKGGALFMGGYFKMISSQGILPAGPTFNKVGEKCIQYSK